MKAFLALAKISVIFFTVLGLSEGQRFCEASSNIKDSGCNYQFQGLNFAATRDDAIEFCKSIDADMGPRLSSTGNFRFFAQKAEECRGRLHSAYSYDASNDALTLDGVEIDRGGFIWKNDSRPSAESPCIVAEYSDDWKLVVTPESCDIELLYICVGDPCFSIDCDEGKTCVATAGTCGYQCVDVTTTTTTTTIVRSTASMTTAEATTESGTTPVSTTSTKSHTTTTETTTTPAHISPTLNAIRSAGGGLEPWEIALIVIGLVAFVAIIGIVIACRISNRCQRYSHYYHEILHFKDHADHHDHEHNVHV